MNAFLCNNLLIDFALPSSCRRLRPVRLSRRPCSCPVVSPPCSCLVPVRSSRRPVPVLPLRQPCPCLAVSPPPVPQSPLRVTWSLTCLPLHFVTSTHSPPNVAMSASAAGAPQPPPPPPIYQELSAVIQATLNEILGNDRFADTVTLGSAIASSRTFAAP